MSDYALTKFTTPNAGVSVSRAGTDISTTAALGLAIENIDTNGLSLTAIQTFTALQTFSGGLAALIIKDTSGNVVFTITAGGGVQIGAPTGGDKGVGTINASALYANGSAIGTITSNIFVNTLGSDVTMNNTSNYFDGPSVAQDTSGTWFASGNVLLAPANTATIDIKLWDGTTVIDSAYVASNTPAFERVHLSGRIATPGGNIRISAKDTGATTSKMVFNQSGLSKDCTLTVFQLA